MHRSPDEGSSRPIAYLLWLAIPLVFYLIPIASGYSWNALGSDHNVLNPPEGYRGRLPDVPITVEPWGTSVVVVPFYARLREYLLNGELPLWNPYQGLGEPFAAQGEGSPYSPLSILRALLPFSAANFITLAVIYGSSFFLFWFLRNLKVTEPAAIFGAAAFVLSGAVSLHLPRLNILEQICLMPVLFWSAELAVRRQSAAALFALAVVTIVHALGGFNQIALLSAYLAAFFILLYARLCSDDLRSWLRKSTLPLGVFALANGATAFNFLPMLEFIDSSFNKNPPMAGFFPGISPANGIGFFFPVLFGSPMHPTWQLPVSFQIDWHNLFAFSGSTVFLTAISATACLSRHDISKRCFYIFFLVSAGLLILRYLTVAPGTLLNLLPLMVKQTLKHSLAAAVFCLSVSAAFALDILRQAPAKRLAMVLVGTLLFFAAAIYNLYGSASFEQPCRIATLNLALTLGIAVTAVVAILLANRSPSLSHAQLCAWLGAVLLAELALTVPLGHDSAKYLLARTAVSLGVLTAGTLWAFGFFRLSVGALVAAFGGLVVVVNAGDHGLPKRFDETRPPRFMHWLKTQTGHGYRSFGIHPNGSSLGSIQDISAVGPLAPVSFLRFVELAANEIPYHSYRSSTHFMLAGPWAFDLHRYQVTRPVFDWFGVRYLVLDKAHFQKGKRTSEFALLESMPNLSVSYEDDRVWIVESHSAQPKACFYPDFSLGEGEMAVLAQLREKPKRILQTPFVECRHPTPVPSSTKGQPISVRIAEYRPNRVVAEVDAPSSGLLVLKDAFASGWQALVNGQRQEVVRVNGIARGVFLPQPGRYRVELDYWPRGFKRGLSYSLVSLLLLALVIVGVRYRTRLFRNRTVGLTRHRQLTVKPVMGCADLHTLPMN
ncbi:MAG: hypothetical protein KatS3mg105_0686 [Gemmatales bacterium]|nr:MAG: hypothetical protein KatS3mg105_0686 [Gemmatales bacterium]